LLYERPRFTNDERIFLDLLAYAPGMNTTQEDILAVVEAEATADSRTAPGTIDPKARELINKARSGGWKTITVPGCDSKDALKLVTDSSGRFLFEHTLLLGLREQVVCDGKQLLHLYPELGVGSRRVVSRFHRAAFADLVPWMLPPLEDLARGADVRWLAERTVAIIPRGVPDADGKAAAPVRTHLLFTPEGRLGERQLLDGPSSNVLERETYGADGTVRRFDSAGKPTVRGKWIVQPGEAPNLSPDLRRLVVLPLPFRSVEHVYRKHNRARPPQEGDLPEDLALELIGSALAKTSVDTRFLIGDRFLKNHDWRPGFYVLAAAADTGPLPQPSGASLETLRYFEWMHDGNINRPHDKLPHFSPGLRANLVRIRDVLELCQRYFYTKSLNPEEQQRVSKFIQSCPSPVFVWAVADLVLTHDGKARTQDQLSVQRQVLDEATSALAKDASLSYVAQYERARLTLETGDRADAQQQFLRLYATARKDGGLPRIDQSFRNILQDSSAHEESWRGLMRETARQLVAGNQRLDAEELGRQCMLLGDEALAGELLDLAIEQVKDDQQLSVTLAAVDLYTQLGRRDLAELQLQTLLASKTFSQTHSIWRLAADFAAGSRQTARSCACLEKALALEYEHLPQEIDLQMVRQDYGNLLAHFEAQAAALATLEQPAPRDLIVRVVRAADRWRSLDIDGTAACQSAARILSSLGAHELAWDYLTTSYTADQSTNWLAVAQGLQQGGDTALADRAYAAALDADPANAQILWAHAEMLRQVRRPAEARPLLRRLAQGQWAAQYKQIQDQARQVLESQAALGY
jgi:hypothetical protein